MHLRSLDPRLFCLRKKKPQAKKEGFLKMSESHLLYSSFGPKLGKGWEAVAVFFIYEILSSGLAAP